MQSQFLFDTIPNLLYKEVRRKKMKAMCKLLSLLFQLNWAIYNSKTFKPFFQNSREGLFHDVVHDTFFAYPQSCKIT